MRVSLMSVKGVESVEVSLDKGLANVKLKASNTVTLGQLQAAITKNGFTMKQSHIIAAGKLLQGPAGAKFQISGSNEVLSLSPESSSAAPPAAGSAATWVLEGTLPEAAKGKVPDAIRYRSLSEEKSQ